MPFVVLSLTIGFCVFAHGCCFRSRDDDVDAQRTVPADIHFSITETEMKDEMMDIPLNDSSSTTDGQSCMFYILA